MVKGPDVFCDVVEKLSKDLPVHVLLTGPSRGYVKNRLSEAGIPYTHRYLEDYNDIVKYFNALDLYIISSRVEGGPKAILESWATGVPLVSTNVGMVPDLMEDGKDGFLVDVDDVENLYLKSKLILEDKKLRNFFIANGLEAVKKNDWNVIAKRYKEEIYDKLK
jgi:glycosyltransferase involved in cell wall biosynthesis